MNTLFFLMAQPQNGAQGGSGWSMLVFFLAIILIFYFFMIRPQQKKQKKLSEAREALKKGDKIVTIGGIHGRISEVEETSFLIEIDEGVKIRVEKAAIAIDENEINKK